MSQQFNFGEWVRRLGYKRSDEPEVIYDVQPVMLVSDVSSLTPEIRGPSALFGGIVIATPGEFGIYEFFSGAPGGAIVGSFAFHTSGISGLTIAIDRPAPVYVASTPVIPQVMQAPIVSTGRIGRTLASIFDLGLPQLPGGLADGPGFWPGDPLWIPPGIRLLIQAGTVNINLSIAHTVQELPADATDH